MPSQPGQLVCDGFFHAGLRRLCLEKAGGDGLSVEHFATFISKSQAPKLFQTNFDCRLVAGRNSFESNNVAGTTYFFLRA
jgi:hypothetical protein